ncbi:FAD-dependent oxidoreductase [Planomonospora algeriensis]
MPHETAVPASGAYDLVVVGGGVAGLSTAWRAARRGLRVAVADPAPASGASHAAAGMLAPVSEVTYTEEPLLRLGLASLARWPAFAAELAADSGLGADALDYRTDGTLEVAFDSDDLAVLDELAAFMGVLGLPVERLTGRECRRLEPMLAPAVRAACWPAGTPGWTPAGSPRRCWPRRPPGRPWRGSWWPGRRSSRSATSRPGRRSAPTTCSG